MKKIDKILDFLFHSKLGIGILVGLALVVALTFTGCFSECASCFGCDDCDDCQASCGNCLCTCTSCDKANCDLNCNGCGRNSCQCGTCVCTQSPSCSGCGCGASNDGGSSSTQSSNSVRLSVKLPNGNTKFVYVSKNTQNGYTVSDLQGISVDADTAKYFTSMGFYTSSGVLAVDMDGKIVDVNALLASAVQYDDYNLSFGGTEAKAGEPVLVKFESEHEELIINPVRVYIGSTITNFQTPELDGYTFVGWRLKNASDAPIVTVVNGETVFHLYDFKAELENSITLEPVFTAN